VTRRIKTWRSTSELIEALRNWSFDPFRVRYRRQPKGRRAKSGQWWRREPATLLDCLHRIVIDEAVDPIPMEALRRSNEP